MGNFQSKGKKQWSIATLNFAGIAHSPFEFYSGTKQQEQELIILSEIFMNLYEISPQKISHKNKRVKNEQKLVWDLSNLDKNMQKQRYSPLYRKDVGIIDGHLMSRAQFYEKWDKEFNKNQHYVKFNDKKGPTQQQKQDCKLFDFLIYKTFVEYIYNHDKEFSSEQKNYILQDRVSMISSSSKKDRETKQKAVIKYKTFLSSQFDKPHLKSEIKLKRINQIMEKNDILFLQDASDELLNALKNEGNVTVIRSEDTECAILVKESFDKIYDQKKIFQNWKISDIQVLKPQRFIYGRKSGKSAVCFVDKFILINVHLSSTDGYQQIIIFMKHLLELRSKFSSLCIIVGGDFNRDFIFSANDVEKGSNQQKVRNREQKQIVNNFYSNFQVYPKGSETNTTIKKRTRLQSQNHKAEEEDKECRDYLIISNNLQKYNQKVIVLGQLIKTKDERLMTEAHPFDHKIVSMTVKRKQ